MPRFVRPGYIADVENPRTRDGYAHARVTVRTPSGDVSRAAYLSAGGMSGRGDAGSLSLMIPSGFAVEIIGSNGETIPGAGRILGPVEIIARPEQ